MLKVSVWQEVCVCFGGVLLRGNRAQKTNASVYRAFSSATYPHLANLGLEVSVNLDKLLRLSSTDVISSSKNEKTCDTAFEKPGRVNCQQRQCMRGYSSLFESIKWQRREAMSRERYILRNFLPFRFRTAACESGQYNISNSLWIRFPLRFLMNLCTLLGNKMGSIVEQYAVTAAETHQTTYSFPFSSAPLFAELFLLSSLGSSRETGFPLLEHASTWGAQWLCTYAETRI